MNLPPEFTSTITNTFGEDGVDPVLLLRWQVNNLCLNMVN